MEKNTSRFSLFANKVAALCGNLKTFCAALCSIGAWALAGYTMDYSGAWMGWAALYMATVTFMLVFLIQHSQNRDTMALHLKLDELIRATHGAHTSMLKVEDLSDNEMTRLSESYKDLANEARDDVRDGKSDIHAPEVNIAGDTPKEDEMKNGE
jgi:low affinity Fe/Cu permease